MGGFVDFLRMILGWKSAVPPAPFTGEGIIIRVPQISYNIIVPEQDYNIVVRSM